MKNLKLRKAINAIGLTSMITCMASLSLIMWGKTMEQFYCAAVGLTIGLVTTIIFTNLDKAYNQTLTK